MHTVKHSPDLQKFIQAAEAFGEIDPNLIKSVEIQDYSSFYAGKDHKFLLNLRSAIKTARDALDISMPDLHKMGIQLDDIIATWSTGPVTDTGEIKIDEEHSHSLKSLGYVPQGHTVIGFDKNRNEIIRGLVKPDRSVDWTSKLEKDRFEKANLFVDQYFNLNANNENYLEQRKEDWLVYLDKMKRDFIVDTCTDDPDHIIGIFLDLYFKPGSSEIRHATFRGQDIMSQINEMERLICENAALTESPAP